MRLSGNSPSSFAPARRPDGKPKYLLTPALKRSPFRLDPATRRRWPPDGVIASPFAVAGWAKCSAGILRNFTLCDGIQSQSGQYFFRRALISSKLLVSWTTSKSPSTTITSCSPISFFATWRYAATASSVWVDSFPWAGARCPFGGCCRLTSITRCSIS